MKHIWGNASTNLQKPPDDKIATGWAPGDILPSNWLNWLLHQITKQLNALRTDVDDSKAQLAELAKAVKKHEASIATIQANTPKYTVSFAHIMQPVEESYEPKIRHEAGRHTDDAEPPACKLAFYEETAEATIVIPENTSTLITRAFVQLDLRLTGIFSQGGPPNAIVMPYGQHYTYSPESRRSWKFDIIAIDNFSHPPLGLPWQESKVFPSITFFGY